MSKSVLASKTLWANVSMIVAAVGAYFMGQTDLYTSIAAIVPSVLNFILRLVTKQPLDV